MCVKEVLDQSYHQKFVAGMQEFEVMTVTLATERAYLKRRLLLVTPGPSCPTFILTPMN